MTNAAGLMENAERMLDAGQLASAVKAMEEARRITKDPDLIVLATYNLGATYWHRLGDGEAARREFNAVVAAFDKHGINMIAAELRGMLPFALDNALLLALSYEEFEALANRVKSLTPKAPTVTQLLPETLRARDQGKPWHEQLFKIASNYYDRGNPAQDAGRYGDARATYQLLLSHRKELRLARETWHAATVEFTVLSEKMTADCLRANGGYRGTYSPEEFLGIESTALPLIDEYLVANPGDKELRELRDYMESFIGEFRAKYARQEARAGR